MSPRFGVVVLAVLYALPCAAQPPTIGPAQTKVALPVQEKVDLTTPALTIKSLVAALNRYDLVQAAQCVVDGKAEAQTQLKTLNDEFKSTRLQIALSEPRVRIQGDWCVASLHIKPRAAPNQPEEGQLQAERVLLRRINGQWKVMGNSTSNPQDPATVAQPPGLEPGSGMLTFIATALIDPSVLIKARNEALRNVCAGHLKQLAISALMLTQDHKDTFAISKAAQNPKPKGMNEVLQALLNEPFQKALFPYAEDAKVFFCPVRIGLLGGTTPLGFVDEQARRDKLMGEIGMQVTGDPYSFNRHLDGMALADIAEPTRTVLFYDGKDEKLNYRHERKANVAFVDGHVKPIDENEARQLIWKP